MNNGKSATATATASCVKARYSLQPISPPCLSSEILKYVDYLEKNPNDYDLLNQFFDNFGTHVVKGVDMGDKFVSRTKFSRKEMYVQKKKGMEVNFNAKAGGWGFSASVGYGQSNTNEKQQKNEKRLETSSMYTIGTPLPKGKNVQD